jgi:hypothetical protein
VQPLFQNNMANIESRDLEFHFKVSVTRSDVYRKPEKVPSLGSEWGRPPCQYQIIEYLKVYGSYSIQIKKLKDHLSIEETN